MRCSLPCARFAVLAAVFSAAVPVAPLAAQIPPVAAQLRHCATPPCVGPVRGTVLVAGGGELPPDVWSTFVRLAGGPDARLVVIPTAEEDPVHARLAEVLDALRSAGATDVTVLHTRDRRVADSEAFVLPLRTATGVWFMGGRQWRLADAYLHTRTQDALDSVLARGGVVAGTSAGASILASFLVRGAPEGNDILMAPGHEEGFGLLHDVAIDEHVIVRGRERDMLAVLEEYPQLLGLGLDEGTALVIQGDRARAIGTSRVAVYGRGGWVHPVPFEWLDAGDAYDLGNGQRIPLAAQRAQDGRGDGGGRLR